MWITWIAGTMLTELLVFLVPDLRTAYSMIPGVAFLFFYFSGMILKASTLPSWAAPWLPSVSLIRWQAQALVLNQYKGDEETFPTVGEGYSTYDEFLNLFGWGGKTKWFCFRILIINLAIYRLLMLFAMIRSVVAQQGKRNLRKVVAEERLY